MLIGASFSFVFIRDGHKDQSSDQKDITPYYIGSKRFYNHEGQSYCE